MNKQALTEILEMALQTLEETFTRARAMDSGLCGQIRRAYYDVHPGVCIFSEKDELPFHTDRNQPILIMEYLRWKYSIDKPIGVFWWPIAVNSRDINTSWAEEGRQSRLAFLDQAIADLEAEIKEDI